MTKRSYIKHQVLLAAALCQLVNHRGERLISHNEAKAMTARQVIARFHRDHDPIRKADGGPDEHWNLTWRLKADHIAKSAKIDAPDMAKERAVRRAVDHHAQAMLLKGRKPRKRKKSKRATWADKLPRRRALSAMSQEFAELIRPKSSRWPSSRPLRARSL